MNKKDALKHKKKKSHKLQIVFWVLLYSPYMVWTLIGTSGIWSIVMGVFIVIAHKNEDKEKARKMIKNYIIGLIAIFVILLAVPLIARGIAALVT